MHILFVKLSAIGDIIHALPALAEVRRHFPKAEISWVAESRSAELLRGNPQITNLIEVDTRSLRGGRKIEEMLIELGRQVRGLRKHTFDIAIDMQGLIKSAAVAKLSGARQRWGFARRDLREPASRFLLTDTVTIPPMTHVIVKNMTLARAALGIGGVPGPLEFPIYTAEEHRAEADAIAERAGGGPIALLNPAGGWVTKLWHAEKFGALAARIRDELGLVPVVATGPAESELAERVLAASGGAAIATEPTLKGFYELARNAKVYVGGDTGPTHLAIAAGAPVVGIFGPTEWWRNGSLQPDDICVERNDIGCRVDCHRRTCSNWICMDIDVDTVTDAVKRRLAA